MKHFIEDSNRIMSAVGPDVYAALGENPMDLQFENVLRVIDARIQGKSRFCGMIFVSGPSASGKTTFSNMLAKKIAGRGISVNVLSLDDFYHDCEYTIRKEKRLGIIPEDAEDGDYETIEAFNIYLFKRVMHNFIAGREVTLPHFNFVTHKSEEGTVKIQRTGKDFLVIEGIQAMNPKLFQSVSADVKQKVFICPFDSYVSREHPELELDQQMIRFMRRATRDSQTRNAGIMRTVEMWPSVTHGEEVYMAPIMQYADFFVNSSYVYEPHYLAGTVLKLYGELTEDEKQEVRRYLAIDAIKLYNETNQMKLPEDSVFREFYFGE